MSSRDKESDHGYAQKSFRRTYRCYPVSLLEKQHLEGGNKILMPMSALDCLVSLNVSYPMVFEIKNPSEEKTSHCGVLEFTAEEGTVFLPCWMMRNLSLEEGDTVVMRNVTLPKGTFMKLQPHTMNFLDISNPKDTLEKALGSYSCVTTGDTIMITDNNKNYYIDIVEAKPSNAISLTDTNCEVDFSPPLDYKEPEKPSTSTASNKPPVLEESDFNTFMGMGIGRRLDGKPSKLCFSSASSSPRGPQHVCCDDMGSASATTSTSRSPLKKTKISHPSGGLAFGSNRQDAHDEPGKPAASALPSKAPVLEKSKSNTFMGMGIAKRLDGGPSKLSFLSTLSSPRGVGSASTSSLTPQLSPENEKTSSPSGGLAFGPNRTDTHKGSSSQQPQNVEVPKFEPFTGKKYSLNA